MFHHITPLLAQGGDDRKDSFDEATARLTLCPEGFPAPQHGSPPRSLRRVVRRLNATQTPERRSGSFSCRYPPPRPFGLTRPTVAPLGEQFFDSLADDRD
jgi:hypothetical protein